MGQYCFEDDIDVLVELEGVVALARAVLDRWRTRCGDQEQYVRTCIRVVYLQFHVPLDLDVEPAMGIDRLQGLLKRREGGVIVVSNIITVLATLEVLHSNLCRHLFCAVDLQDKR